VAPLAGPAALWAKRRVDFAAKPLPAGFTFLADCVEKLADRALWKQNLQ